VVTPPPPRCLMWTIILLVCLLAIKTTCSLSRTVNMRSQLLAYFIPVFSIVSGAKLSHPVGGGVGVPGLSDVCLARGGSDIKIKQCRISFCDCMICRRIFLNEIVN
jgi:hypothetical protein